eukprot:scaffold25575_cov118-Isochrysis_galbana.AAC.4
MSAFQHLGTQSVNGTAFRSRPHRVRKPLRVLHISTQNIYAHALCSPACTITITYPSPSASRCSTGVLYFMHSACQASLDASVASG